jgi:hypothetical protein
VTEVISSVNELDMAAGYPSWSNAWTRSTGCWDEPASGFE